MAEVSKEKNIKHETEEAEKMLRDLLKDAGFKEAVPNVKTAWEAFKKMCEYEFDCGGDDLLFEAGVYDFIGKELLYLAIVRQFTIEVEEEYDYMVELRMEFSYEPKGALRELEETISTYEFDDDFQRFFEAVEKSPAFLLPQENDTPVGFELILDEI